MHARISYLIFLLSSIYLAQATIYVNEPTASTTCYGGQPCTVSWLDNGEQPLLGDIGACFVGLYIRDGELVQQIEPVNVASVHSLQFVPDPAAGPNSNTYYLNFTSISLTNQTSHYIQYSADFTLASMSGSSASPVATDTSTLAVPSSVLSPSSNPVVSTSTISNSFSSTATAISPASSFTGSNTVTASSSGFSSSRTVFPTVISSSSSTLPSSTHSATSAAARSVHISLRPTIVVLVMGLLYCTTLL